MFDRLIGLIAPAECVICGKSGLEMCSSCAAGLPEVPQICFACETDSEAGKVCLGCANQTALAGVFVAASYGDKVKDIILRLKFRRARRAAEPLGDLLAGRLPASYVCDAVTSVPVSPARRRERGYNQSELIARRVARRLGLPYYTALGRTTAQHQIGLGRAERRRQVRGAFYPVRRLEGARLLLVDDVITTGATLDECARTLKEAGATSILGAAVARHLSQDE
jgi:ComF family protein